MNRINKHIKVFLLAILAAGLFAMLAHPVVHLLEAASGYVDTHQESELPFSEVDDCIECILTASVALELDINSSIIPLKTDHRSVFKNSTHVDEPTEFGFSLRAPPVLYV